VSTSYARKLASDSATALQILRQISRLSCQSASSCPLTS